MGEAHFRWDMAEQFDSFGSGDDSDSSKGIGSTGIVTVGITVTEEFHGEALRSLQ